MTTAEESKLYLINLVKIDKEGKEEVIMSKVGLTSNLKRRISQYVHPVPGEIEWRLSFSKPGDHIDEYVFHTYLRATGCVPKGKDRRLNTETYLGEIKSETFKMRSIDVVVHCLENLDEYLDKTIRSYYGEYRTFRDMTLERAVIEKFIPIIEKFIDNGKNEVIINLGDNPSEGAMKFLRLLEDHGKFKFKENTKQIILK